VAVLTPGAPRSSPRNAQKARQRGTRHPWLRREHRPVLRGPFVNR